LRRVRPAAAEGRPRAQDRRPAEHGVGDLGRRARLLHVLAPCQLGQEGQGQRAVPEGLPLGREAPVAALPRRLPRGRARTAAHHALRPGAVLQEPDLRRVVIRAALAAPAVAAEVAAPERLRGVDPAALGYTYAVGTFAPEYAPPAPGSYTLPIIQTVHDHPLVDADGRPTTLFTLKRGRVAVVAFIYTTCIDVAGCPLGNAVLERIDRALAAEPSLERRARVITVRFDLERVTTSLMSSVRALN